MFSLCLLAFMVSTESQLLTRSFSPLCNMLFSLAVFKVCSLSLAFNNLTLMCTSVYFFGVYSVWCLFTILYLQISVFHQIKKNLRHYFFKYFFSAPFCLLPPSGIPVTHIFDYLVSSRVHIGVAVLNQH